MVRSRPARLRGPRRTDGGVRPRPWSTLFRVGWFGALLAAVVAVVLPWTNRQYPSEVPLWGAVAVTALLTHGLAVRTGGRPLLSGGLALTLASAAALTRAPVLLAAAAVTAAVVAAILGVLGTVPAARFRTVVREVVVAAAVASAGAFAVRAYEPQVSLARMGYLVLGLALLGALLLVHRLAAGLHGLDRRSAVMIGGGVVLLTLTLAYTEALSRWGSPGLQETVEATYAGVRDLLGAVPRPVETLLSVPALAWGVSVRARRPQGWWVCAFGAPGLAVVAVSLLDGPVNLAAAGMALGYSLLFGLAFGYLLIRADLYLAGARGRRARRIEALAAHRPEAPRLEPLL